MKSFYPAVVLVATILFLPNFNPYQSDPLQESARVIQRITEQFHLQLAELADAVDNYVATAAAYDRGQASIAVLRAAHLTTRLAFKKAEYLLEYNDRYAVKRALNGPPLPSVEPHVPEVNVLQARGLQVLDELVFAEEPAASDVHRHVVDLQKDYAKIFAYQRSLSLEHRQLIEAMRLEITRVFTLGLTGFDTPGSLNALPEARAVFTTLARSLQHYQPLVSAADPSLYKRLENQLAGALAALTQTDDFAAFDRLAFYRDHLRPLDQLLATLHTTLGVETWREAGGVPQPLALDTAALFSADFFNTAYYRGFVDDAALPAKIELGQLLFYDPILSANNERACASCHRAEAAFTDGRAKSLALDGEQTIARNAPTLLNAVYTERYFYDLRETQLERQIKHVVLDEHEFATDFLTIMEKLAQSAEYRRRFAAAYPVAGISKYAISNALAAYLAELSSFDSEFDRYARGELTTLDAEVQAGFNLFMGKAACGTCHFAPTFSGLVPPYYTESESEVLGVPVSPGAARLDPDPGRIASNRPIDEAPFYEFSFKTTTVRNVAHTAPYMHNGAYADLNAVLDFYNKGGGAGLGIAPDHQTLAPDDLNLDQWEIQAIISFMNSLSDLSKVGKAPASLPEFAEHPSWNDRPIGGSY